MLAFSRIRQDQLKLIMFRYTQALVFKLDREVVVKLYSNRSLASCKSKRFAEALEDAERAVSMAPKWDKAHWRKGSALLGLCRYQDAIAAFLNAWHLNQGARSSHD